jgi:parvulin-like peptidyl-prolyl isomerase
MAQKANRSAQFFAVLFAFSIVAPVLAVAQNAPQQPTGKPLEVLAVVNGQQITRQQIANECMRRFGEDVLESIVNKMLVLEQCQRNGIQITEQDVNDDIVQKAKKFGMSGERYVQLICSRRNITASRLKNDIIWNELALRRLAQKHTQVSPDEIQQRLEFEFGEKIQVRQITVDAESKAKELHAAVLANPDDFGRLAKDHSIDPNSASVRGLLPPIRRNAGLPEFENVAFSLQQGQISDIFPLGNTFVILKCERIFPAMELTGEQLEAAEKRIQETLGKEKLADAATDLFKQMQESAELVNVMNDPERSKQMPGVAAIVNGQQILKNQVGEECIARFGTNMLDTEINRVMLMQSLEANGMQVTQEDVNYEIDRAATSLGYVNEDGEVDMARWLAFVTSNEPDKIDFYIEDQVWPTVALKKLVQAGVEVTDEDLQKGFEANFGPRVEVLAIVANDHRHALKVWNMASANPEATYFGQLANQFSVEPASKANFGEVPPIQKHGGRPELEAEAFSLDVGEISKVVQVGENWIIMYCLGRTQPRVTEFEAVRDELDANIREKKLRLAMGKRFQSMREDAQIDNFLAGTSQTGKAAVRAARQTHTASDRR